MSDEYEVTTTVGFTEGVKELMFTLEDFEETPQFAMDLLFTSAVLFKSLGSSNVEQLKDHFEEQLKLAGYFISKLEALVD